MRKFFNNSNFLNMAKRLKKLLKSSKDEIIVGLDVGTTKICIIVAKISERNSIDIVGIGMAPSEGLHRGIVVNPSKTIESIKASIADAELNSGVKIESASVGVSGHHIKCITSKGTIGISDSNRVISENDIQRLIEQARLERISSDMMIIDIIPQEFTIDGKDGIYDIPIGMFGKKVEAKMNVITGLISSIEDLSECVRSCNIEIDDIVLEPIASANAVLEESEKRIGVAMLDIGGGTTDIAVFKRGVLKWTEGVGIAGSMVTKDIVEGLGISETEAERVKKEYGCALVSEILQDSDIVIESIRRNTPKKTKKSILTRIIQARMEDIFDLSAVAIKNSGIQNELHAGVIITGGGSLIRGTKELAEKILGMEINLGIPRGLSGGLLKEVESPIFATGVGLVLHRLKTLYGSEQYMPSSELSKKKKFNAKNIYNIIKKWFG